MPASDAPRPLHVLVLCTGNSARSILGECLLERLGAGRVRAFSAGSQPKTVPHPLALALLEERGFETRGLRSKSWDEFAEAGAPPIDAVITVCDSARAETCPVWPGHPVSTHWGLADPAACEGTPEEQRAAFERAWAVLEHRVRELVALPFEEMPREALSRALDAIGSALPGKAALSPGADPEG